jgi:hypothetical protein
MVQRAGGIRHKGARVSKTRKSQAEQSKQRYEWRDQEWDTVGSWSYLQNWLNMSIFKGLGVLSLHCKAMTARWVLVELTVWLGRGCGKTEVEMKRKR